MKKLTLLLIFASAGLSAQTIYPVIGVNYTGGLSYDFEHEPISGKLGIVYEPKKTNLINNIELSGNYYYVITPEKPNMIDRDFYNIKIQVAKEVVEYWNVVSYVGYVNAFDGNIMKSYDGSFKTNLSYGLGIQTFDDYITAELLFEQLAGYSHLSIGIMFKFKKRE